MIQEVARESTSKYEHGDYQQEVYYMDETGSTYCEVWLAVIEK